MSVLHSLLTLDALSAALAASVALTLALTVLLFVAGRRPLSRRWRLVGLAVVSIAPVLPLGAAIAAVAVAVIALVLPRHWYLVGSWLFAALLTSTGLYVVYLVHATLALGAGPVSLLFGVVLLALQAGAMALLLGAAFEMIDALCAPPVDPPLPPAPDRWPVVCVQVPTYNEPPELVIETIRSLVRLDYPALRVQVIDNNTTDPDLWRPLQAECQRLRGEGHRVDFAHLPEWPGYKGGALNWGLSQLPADVEIVGVVDADYVVEPDWLRATVPHFNDENVAFVQTPQEYREWEGSSFYRACHAGFALFFAVGMVSRARRNSIIFAGTMGLIRRDVVAAVGGWDERIITEDAEISVRVLARGHRAVYVPRPYGRGIMPLTYEGLRKQRFRWAFGGIQILRRHWRTLLGPRSGLTLGQRYDHLLGGLWWFNDALTLGFTLFVAAAALGAAAGTPFVVQRLTGIGLILPVAYIALNLSRYLWALRTATGASPALAVAALRVNMSLSWVVALACVRGLTQERGVFLRTPKFQGAAVIRELRVVAVETTLAVAGLALLVLVVLGAGFAPVALALVPLLAWSTLVYASATAYALGDPTRAPLADALAAKARLEISPRVGRVARSRPARAGVGAAAAMAVLAVVAALEAGRPPVDDLPFQERLQGPVALLPRPVVPENRPTLPVDATTAPSPSAAATDAVAAAAQSAAPGAPTPTIGSATPGPTAAAATPVPDGARPAPRVEPTPRATPVVTAPPRATPAPSPRAPAPTAPPRATPLPTPVVPTAAPTARPTVRPTAQPVPTAAPTAHPTAAPEDRPTALAPVPTPRAP